MQMIPISNITAEKLKAGEYTESIPEYYRLKNVTENGVWHTKQNVFDHVVKVFSSYEELLHFSFLSLEQRQKIETYLNQKITTHTRKDILTLTVLLHDIAKEDTLISHEDGTANCPGHELIGAGRMQDFAQRFELSKEEENRLERMVRFHGFVSEIIERIRETKEVEHNRTLFANTVGDVALDLLLFIYSDLHGCDLDSTKPDLFAAYKQIQISYIQDLIEHS